MVKTMNTINVYFIEDKTDDEIIHWSQLQGNPFIKKPTTAMYFTGEILVVKGLLKGQPRNKSLSDFYHVKYDKSYVIKYFINKIVLPFNLPRTVLEQIIKAALDDYYGEVK